MLSTQTALRNQAEDNYSWMLTAVPDPTELPPVGSTLAQLTDFQQKSFTVSIITFYKRDFLCDGGADSPSERFVEILFTGTGMGGGDATLTAPATVTSLEQAEEYLKVKDNEWIMVTALRP